MPTDNRHPGTPDHELAKPDFHHVGNETSAAAGKPRQTGPTSLHVTENSRLPRSQRQARAEPPRWRLFSCLSSQMRKAVSNGRSTGSAAWSKRNQVEKGVRRKNGTRWTPRNGAYQPFSATETNELTWAPDRSEINQGRCTGRKCANSTTPKISSNRCRRNSGSFVSRRPNEKMVKPDGTLGDTCRECQEIEGQGRPRRRPR